MIHPGARSPVPPFSILPGGKGNLEKPSRTMTRRASHSLYQRASRSLPEVPALLARDLNSLCQNTNEGFHQAGRGRRRAYRGSAVRFPITTLNDTGTVVGKRHRRASHAW